MDAQAQLTKDQWITRIAPYHFFDWMADPIKKVWAGWEDDGPDPLGAMLEWIKWAQICPLHDVPASVMFGQMMDESDNGNRQDCPMGIKATAADKAAGNAERFQTLELLEPADVARIQAAGDFIAMTGRRSKDASRIEISCYQWFYKGTVQGNVNKYLAYYEGHKPARAGFMGQGPEAYLRGVTTAAPFAYATGEGYVQGVMGRIKQFDLTALDGPTA